MVLPFELIFEGIKGVGNSFIQPIFVPILYVALQALPALLTFWTKGDRIHDQNELKNPYRPQVYDFIVVGGGTAGAVVANRLSRSYNVLLLEAGGDPNPVQFIPSFGQMVLNFEEIDYGYRAVPQKRAFMHSVNQQTSMSAGLGLGGSGTLNLMIHLRGHVKDFDNWANLTGDERWSWNGVLPHFKSYEDYEIPGDNVNHGYGGDLRIEAPDYIGTAREFVQAGMEFQFPNVDLNAPHGEGFDVIRYPIKYGIRQSTYKAFIEPVKTRLSLTIMKFAQVNKILFKNEGDTTSGQQAYGVVFDRHGETITAYASKEIIITAGAIETAKLLMLSGIGPKSHLEELGIPVIADLPVGQNLKDHAGVLLSPFLLREPRSTLADRDLTISSFFKWLTMGRGRLTSSSAEATGMLSSSFAKARGEDDWPDVQLLLACFGFTAGTLPLFTHAFSLKYDVAKAYYSPTFNRDACHVVVVLTRPQSKGFVRLGGRSPYDKPIIDPNYFENETDMKVLVEGVKKTLVLMENSTSFGVALGARFSNVRLPGCDHLDMITDEYWECFARHWTISIHHSTGTAPMGKVVDTDLRVLGTQNLRVMDNSIPPEIVSANTQASTLMIAEKGSYMILTYWKKRNFKRALFEKQQLFEAQVKALPVKEVPIKALPVKELPVNATSVTQLPVNATSVKELPVNATSVKMDPVPIVKDVQPVTDEDKENMI